MIVYSGSVRKFEDDADNGVIAKNVEKKFIELGLPKEQRNEFESWKNSLTRMSSVLEKANVDPDVQVAIEFQIPLTCKRVDFMLAGNDGVNDNIVVIELKQWSECQATTRENVVIAYTGGAYRDVAHPCQQAYAYAKLIENFNESVQEENISLIPCAFLHNYDEVNRGQICHPNYQEIIDLSPVFLQEDVSKLREFINKYVNKPSKKKLFEIVDYGKLRPSKSLQDSVGSIMNGNKEFELVDEQVVAYSTVLKLVENSINDDKKHTVIVKGGPGTGKSVIAINLLAKLLNNGKTALYITKNSAPRKAFSDSLLAGKYALSYLKGLFRSSGIFYKVKENTFDCLLVDEAHRLNLKSGLYSNQGENQIKEIINASKISVFFIDEDQKVTTKDIGSIDEIKKWAEYYGSQVHDNSSLTLKSQFRCNGSNGYLSFLDSLLEIRQTANSNYYDLDYDVQVFDDPCLMREELRKKNTNNKARMIAGYCYEWESKNNKRNDDIILENGFKAQWNFSTDGFANDPNSFEQVGCIHSTQGIEFEYCGIIIGKDLRFENGHVITDPSKEATSDHSSGIRSCKDKKLADKLIRNTYKTLLSRGQKGCYIYCEDKELSDYIKERLNKCKN